MGGGVRRPRAAAPRCLLPPSPTKNNAPPRPGPPGHAAQDLLGPAALQVHGDAQFGEEEVDGGGGGRGGGRRGVLSARIARRRCRAGFLLALGHGMEGSAAQDEGGPCRPVERGGDGGGADEEVEELAHCEEEERERVMRGRRAWPSSFPLVLFAPLAPLCAAPPHAHTQHTPAHRSLLPPSKKKACALSSQLMGLPSKRERGGNDDDGGPAPGLPRKRSSLDLADRPTHQVNVGQWTLSLRPRHW